MRGRSQSIDKREFTEVATKVGQRGLPPSPTPKLGNTESAVGILVSRSQVATVADGIVTKNGDKWGKPQQKCRGDVPVQSREENAGEYHVLVEVRLPCSSWEESGRRKACELWTRDPPTPPRRSDRWPLASPFPERGRHKSAENY